MKSTTFAIGSLLASIAIAQPHRHAGHQAYHNKREVVWTTEIETVYETVDITTTIWVSEGEVLPTPSAPAPAPVSSVSVAAADALPSNGAPIPAQFFEPQAAPVPSTSEAPVPTPSSTPAYVAPAPASTYVAPEVAQPIAEPVAETPAAAPAASTPTPVVEASTPVVEAPAPVAETSTPVAEAPAPAPVAETSAPVVEAPATSTPEVAAATPQDSSSSSPAVDTSVTGSSSGACTEGDACSGDLTFYDPVPESWGACGWHNDGLKEKVIALPVGLMGAQSNGNPYCGRNVTILHNGKSTTAMVVDKCMGCEGRSIDISRFAFDDLDDQGVGRTTATWYFSD